MKKVLVVIYTPTYGGPHNQVTQLYDPLLKKGWETVALLPQADKESYKKLNKTGIKVLTRPLRRLRAKHIIRNNWDYVLSFRENVRQIKEIIQRENIDVVQVCGLMHIHAALACRELQIPLVWQFLGTFAPLPLRIIYTPFAVQYADWIMTTGMRTAKQHVFHRFFSKKHTIFFPPVNTDKFSSSSTKRAKAREWMGVPQDAFLVGTVGNQNKTKAHERIVDIAEDLSGHRDIFFRVVGKHTPSHAEYYQKEVIEKARRKGLISSGKLTILEDELPIETIMAGFDLFLLTSRIEGIPTVILEAMSMGLPIVTNEVGSIREVVSHNSNGCIYSNKVEACKEILKLKDHSAFRYKMHQRNRSEAVDKYDVSVCAHKHAGVYRTVESKYEDFYDL